MEWDDNKTLLYKFMAVFLCIDVCVCSRATQNLLWRANTLCSNPVRLEMSLAWQQLRLHLLLRQRGYHLSGKMPFKRQLITIKANKIKACGIGWFKKTEREKFAWFSQPIYKDKPTVAISKKGNKSLLRHSTILSCWKTKP